MELKKTESGVNPFSKASMYARSLTKCSVVSIRFKWSKIGEVAYTLLILTFALPWIKAQINPLLHILLEIKNMLNLLSRLFVVRQGVKNFQNWLMNRLLISAFRVPLLSMLRTILGFLYPSPGAEIEWCSPHTHIIGPDCFG